MSFEYLNRAMREQFPPTSKVILIFLARLADENGNCDPSIDTIAEFASVTRVTVSSTLRALEEAGVLRITRRPGYPSTYRLNLGRPS
ncbi:helix-turn-helix domain-containing protein [Burkholderia pseudomallei]|uniref:helix-turn-helix domain-containing protein n=1 Tax=pseudomallei group TaxID=111527 RepID=UPI0012E72FB9|nr:MULTISPECIES: helix-turn-helix domain-containing protein [pseudomallei group]MBF3887240.1 helix-turn-helix domain-containing protein [Burkholderia pseudomallei]MBF3893910.1 helix-turn-helix domain-containing protein [Burkholderia pseudomallei]MUV29152.1 helix-turn-helix domain-containing protein [Burkholderia thailandensis]MUV31459.1 helix-turn-helix domain-containing protein [Burkholderia thailandensis]